MHNLAVVSAVGYRKEVQDGKLPFPITIGIDSGEQVVGMLSNHKDDCEDEDSDGGNRPVHYTVQRKT